MTEILPLTPVNAIFYETIRLINDRIRGLTPRS